MATKLKSAAQDNVTTVHKVVKKCIKSMNEIKTEGQLVSSLYNFCKSSIGMFRLYIFVMEKLGKTYLFCTSHSKSIKVAQSRDF